MHINQPNMIDPTKPFVLHIGMSKTATTSFQENLFARHSQIYYLGKSLRYTARSLCRTEDIYEAIAPCLWNFSTAHDPAKSRAFFQKDYAAHREYRVAVASREEFGSRPDPQNFAEMLFRIQQTFGTCKVLVVIRNPLAWVTSEYLQRLRWHFTRNVERPFGTRTYLDIAEWMKRFDACARGSGLFTYGPNIRAAVDTLGKENVGVFLYEDLLENSRRFVDRISDFLGIDASESNHLMAAKEKNARMTIGQLRLIKATDRSAPRRFLWRLGSVKWRRRLLHSAAVSRPPFDAPARIQLTTEEAHKVAMRTREDNRWLAESFGLDLSKHGYPL